MKFRGSRYDILKVLVFFLLAIGTFVCCYFARYSGDDYRWIFNFFRGEPQPSSFEPTAATILHPNFVAAWNRACLLWHHLNGRFLCNLLNGIAAGLTRFEWALLNTSLFTVLCWQIWRLSGAGKHYRFLTFLLAFCFLFQNETVLWRCGSANYLWPMVWTHGGWMLFVRLSPENDRRSILSNLGLLVFGAVLGAGHELIGLTICLLLVAYWLRDLFKRRRIEFNGRMALSVGYGIGVAFTVLSPGNIERAGGASFFAIGGNLVFHFGWKARLFLQTLGAVPAFIALLVVAFLAYRRNVPRLCIAFLTLPALVAFAVVMFFGGGQGRVVWPLQVFSVMAVLSLLSVISVDPRTMKCLSLVMCAWAIAIIGATSLQTVRVYEAQNLFVAHGRSARRAYYERPSVASLPSALGPFARSLDIGGALPYGSQNLDCRPYVFSRFHKMDPFVIVAREMIPVLDRLEEFSVPSNRLPCAGEWYALKDVDLIWSPYEGSFPQGSALIANPRYEGYPQKSMMERILIRLRQEGAREITGNTYPYEMMASNAQLKGFVLLRGGGAYQVFIHDRNIPRACLRNISEVRIERGDYKFENSGVDLAVR